MACCRLATRGRNKPQSFKPCATNYSEAPRSSLRYRRIVAPSWTIEIPLCLVCKMNSWLWHQSKSQWTLTLLPYCAYGAEAGYWGLPVVKVQTTWIYPSSPWLAVSFWAHHQTALSLIPSSLRWAANTGLHRAVAQGILCICPKKHPVEAKIILILCLDLPQVTQLIAKLNSEAKSLGHCFFWAKYQFIEWQSSI